MRGISGSVQPFLGVLDGGGQGGGFYGEGVVALDELAVRIGRGRRGEDSELDGLAAMVEEA